MAEKTLIVFCATQFLVWLCYMLPVPILPEVATQRNITEDIVGIILAIYTIPYIIASFLLGKMMVKIGKVT